MFGETLAATRVRGVIAALLIGVMMISTVSAQSTPGPASGNWQVTALAESVVSTPRWFTGTDGQVHLVYELMLTNAIPVPVTVTSVEVLDADSGATVISLSGDDLLAAMSLVTLPDTPAVQLAPSTVGVIWLDIPLANEGALPKSIAHRVSVELPPDLVVNPAMLTSTGAPVAVDQRAPVVIGPPLVGSGWLALGSCCDGPHRRSLFAVNGEWRLGQRMAIDFNQLDAQNRPGTGDPMLYTSFPTYDQPVIAVADATVVEAVDRFPDLNVGEAREDVTSDTAGGNRIVLDLGEGRFAVYAHLAAGSVTVKAGDQVRRGEQIAKVGSSGTSGGPHLHFQVTDRPSVINADGLPFVFDAFDLTGQTPPLADVIPYYDTLDPIPVATENPGPRTNALPLGSDLVAFPEQGTGG